jgi:antitoxin VapB
VLRKRAPVVRTTLFKSNRTQAVRLAKDVTVPNDVTEIAIIKKGNKWIIAPADASWDDFFAAPRIELGVREQPELQARESLFDPRSMR